MKRKRPKDLTGQRFGRLVVVERMDQKTKYGCWLYRCKCDCGNEKIVVAGNLKAGLTKRTSDRLERETVWVSDCDKICRRVKMGVRV